MSSANGTRIYFQAKNPNPLFIEWMEYWLKQAEEKDSMKKFTLAKALESLRKYPLVLYSGRDCAILEGFGSGICTMIDKQLEAYRTSHPGRLLSEQKVEAKEKSIIIDVKTKLERAKTQQKKNVISEFKDKLDDTLEALLNDGAFDQDFEMPVSVMTQPINMQFMPSKMRFHSGSYKIILLVDTQETAG